MGFHVCEYCENDRERPNDRYPNVSSGDVTLTFDEGGGRWQMPDMILHYVHDHGWKPPDDFIDAVMRAKGLMATSRRQTRGPADEETLSMVGYLRGPINYGQVPEGFVGKLERFLKEAANASGNPYVYERRPPGPITR